MLHLLRLLWEAIPTEPSPVLPKIVSNAPTPPIFFADCNSLFRPLSRLTKPTSPRFFFADWLLFDLPFSVEGHLYSRLPREVDTSLLFFFGLFLAVRFHKPAHLRLFELISSVLYPHSPVSLHLWLGPQPNGLCKGPSLDSDCPFSWCSSFPVHNCPQALQATMVEQSTPSVVVEPPFSIPYSLSAQSHFGTSTFRSLSLQI